MKITVVRHGETEGNIARIVQSRTGGRLTENGKLQAQVLADQLNSECFEVVYCSTLDRCIETADILISNHPEVEVIYSDELIERGLGVYEGRPWADVPWESIEGNNLHKKLSQGESWIEVEKRIETFINTLLEEFPDKHILIVTHGGVIKAFNALISDVTLRQAVDTKVVSNASALTWDIHNPVRSKTVA